MGWERGTGLERTRLLGNGDLGKVTRKEETGGWGGEETKYEFNFRFFFKHYRHSTGTVPAVILKNNI